VTNTTTAGKLFSDPKLYDNLAGLTGDMRLLIGDSAESEEVPAHQGHSFLDERPGALAGSGGVCCNASVTMRISLVIRAVSSNENHGKPGCNAKGAADRAGEIHLPSQARPIPSRAYRAH